VKFIDHASRETDALIVGQCVLFFGIPSGSGLAYKVIKSNPQNPRWTKGDEMYQWGHLA
jgi:hypothetical protein